jgi:hypothetical protein
VLQTIRRLLIRPGCFRLERELPGGICAHDIDAPWQGAQWNKIEHRLFSFITMNWKATPLVSYRVIVDLIAATTTKTGLTVKCELDSAHYPKGVAVSRGQMDTLNIAVLHGSRERHSDPVIVVSYAMRTDSGRPSFNMRFNAQAAISTSVDRRASVRDRSASPITRL